eukprot:symbB.v1.2.023361.t1/scaffold2133.1/size88229/6
MKSQKSHVESLLKSGVRVLLYQGQFDWKDGFVSNAAWIRTLSWAGTADFLSSKRHLWRRGDGEIAGYWKKFENLEQVLVLGAGHLVPMNQPLSAVDMMQRFLRLSHLTSDAFSDAKAVIVFFKYNPYQSSIWWIQKKSQAMDFLPMELLEWNLSMDDPIGLLRELLPVVLALFTALLAARALLRSGDADCQVKGYIPPHHGHPELKLCSPDVPTLTFFGEQLHRLRDEVKRIYAVDHGSKPPFGTGNCVGSDEFVPPCDIAESIRQMRAACADLQESRTGSWRSYEPLDDLFYARHLIAVDFHHARAVQVVRNYVAYRHQHHGGIFPDYSWLKLGMAVIPFEDLWR